MCSEAEKFFSVSVFDSANPYAPLSDQAHIVLGSFVIGIVFVWAVYLFKENPFGSIPVLEPLRLNHVFYCSGFLQSMMGLYLLFWLFVLLNPSRLYDVWMYTTSDLLQLQHLCIALNLLSAGLIELLNGGLGIPDGRSWHTVWCVNMAMVGLTFLAHPQKTVVNTQRHLILGMSLVAGSVMFLISKREMEAELVRVRERQSPQAIWNRELEQEKLEQELIQQQAADQNSADGNGGERASEGDKETGRASEGGEESESDETSWARRRARKREGEGVAHLKADCNLCVACVCFTVAGGCLLRFHEHPAVHMGITPECQGAWLLTRIGLWIPIFSLSLLLLFGTYDASIACKRKRIISILRKNKREAQRLERIRVRHHRSVDCEADHEHDEALYEMTQLLA